jgi:GMP synthase (glutamine-hydrolysing)
MKYRLLQARNPNDIAKQEELECFANRLQVPLSAIESVDVLQQELHLGLTEGIDAILVGGSGEYSVLDKDVRIQKFISFLGECTNTDTPVFASCFGFQALVVALGGIVVKDVPNAEVGTYVLHTTEHANTDPVFSVLPSPFWAQLGHQDQAKTLPECLVHFASSEKTFYQACKFTGKNIYATQFHPELTDMDNRKRFGRYMPIYGKLFGDEEAQRRMDSHRPSVEANLLLEKFQQLIQASQ